MFNSRLFGYSGIMLTSKILIVEDDPAYRLLLKRMLENEGFSDISEAETGEQALHSVLNDSPDLVLMDIEIPCGNGIETTRKIMAVRPNSKIVIITGFGTPARAMESINAGACNFLLKPFEIQHIRPVIRQALRTDARS